MISLHRPSLDIWQEQNLEHIRYEYDLNPGEFCIDIGSYHREWANAMIERYSVQVECFDALDDRAAWVFDGRIDMGGAYYYTSMFMPSNSTCKCEDIAKYLQRDVAVCKVNIEGGEYQLIDYIIESGAIANIRNLQVQFHLIEGADAWTAYDLLAKRLSNTHELTWRYEFCWENWKRKC